jgi:hypothetical protein
MSNNLLSNPSWAHGKWQIEYNKEKDRYIITTEYDVFVAEVGLTLVAHWIVEVHNTLWK